MQHKETPQLNLTVKTLYMKVDCVVLLSVFVVCMIMSMTYEVSRCSDNSGFERVCTYLYRRHRDKLFAELILRQMPEIRAIQIIVIKSQVSIRCTSYLLIHVIPNVADIYIVLHTFDDFPEIRPRL